MLEQVIADAPMAKTQSVKSAPPPVAAENPELTIEEKSWERFAVRAKSRSTTTSVRRR